MAHNGHVFVRTHANGGTSVAVTQADLNAAWHKALIDPRTRDGLETIVGLLQNLGITIVMSPTCDSPSRDSLPCFLTAGHKGPHDWRASTTTQKREYIDG